MSQTTVYLLDDEPNLLELLSDVVSMAGLKPQSFTRASCFFAEVDKFEPGAILVLDLHIPEMDGIEVMRRLAEQSTSPAIILMSGHDTSVLHSAEKLGKAHNLELISSFTKPIDIDQFQHTLEQYTKKTKHQNIEHAKVHTRTLGVSDLQQAIRTNQLVLHYQPQLDIATEQIIGAEALVRWQHPELGLIFPDQFIPMAEKAGMIGNLTHWVIDKAVHQEQIWQTDGLSLPVSVNISAIDITSLTLPEHLAQLLEDKKLNPTQLTLEVTEGALMGELVTSLDILTRLRLKGFGLSIDDFGTGYSSLSQLHRVPFSELKIDRSFVSNIEHDDEARAIVKTCIILAHELKMKVVAEGLETTEQLLILKRLNCDYAQGYFFSKPLEASTFKEFLLSHQASERYIEQQHKRLIENESSEPLVWSKKYKVGIGIIDEDHKQLIYLLDQCRKVADKQSSEILMNKVINDLILYTQTHFKREEALMAACEYPNFEKHHKIHQAIIKQVENMHEQLVQGTVSRTKLIIFLTEWLVSHIGIKDMEMAKFCLAKPECIEKVTQQFAEQTS